MTDLEALAKAIDKIAAEADDEDAVDAGDYGANTEPEIAKMYGLVEHHTVGLADYILVLGTSPDGDLIMGVAPQSRDYYGGPTRMEWPYGWAEKVDDEYLGLDDIANWIVRAIGGE